MSPSEEARLLARCRQGDSGAWDSLFADHYTAAGRFVAQLVPEFNREDVEEICQETFLTVIKNLSSFQGQSRFQTWLFRVAANKAKDYRQRQRAAKRGGGQTPLSLGTHDPDDGPTLDPPTSAPGPDLVLIQAENLALIGEAVRLLKEPCREIIELRYYADLSYEEIANTLRLNLKTVSSRLSKCLDKLELIARALLAREKKTPSHV